MIKDLLASMNDIYSDSNLDLKEKSILMYLIKQFNIKDKYAYPTYENIMSATGIGRRANVADAIKSLVVKGYITVKKTIGNKSHYFIEKYLHFVRETTQEVDSNENKNLSENKTEEIQVKKEVEIKETSIKSIIVSDCKESGIQMTIDDVEEVKVKQHPNNSKIAKETKINLTPYYCEAFSHIDEIVLEMALKEKAKSATLLLRKCIRISKEIGLAFGKEFNNKVLKFKDYKDEYELTCENNEVYKNYIDRKVELELF